MLSRSILTLLECALSTNKHIVMHAIPLSCGHTACKECLQHQNQTTKHKCHHCDKINKLDVRECDESLATRYLFEFYLKDLSKRLGDKFEQALNRFQQVQESFENQISQRIEFIKEEIDVRVESLKNELDLLQNEMNKQLDNIKEEILNTRNEFDKASNGYNQYEIKLKELFNDINKSKYETNKFYEYQKELIEVNSAIEKAFYINNQCILQLKFKLSEFKHDLSSIGEIDYNSFFRSGSIILDSNELSKLNVLCGWSPSKKLELLYRGSTDGFASEIFHQKCDNYPNTLVIIRSSNDYIFGGFTTQLWNHTDGYKTDAQAFLFSFKNKDNKPAKFNVSKAQYAIYCGDNYGPIFGGNGGHDIYISSNSCSNTSSASYLNSCYASTHVTCDPWNYFAGSHKFQVNEIEVFQVNF